MIPELYKIIISFEFELISAMSDPKGGNRVPSIKIRPQEVCLREGYIFVRIRAYLRYIEPEGRKPSALYQNPGTISRFEKTMDLGPGAWGGPRAFGRGVNPSLNLSSGTAPLATDWSLLASPLPILSRSRLL